MKQYKVTQVYLVPAETKGEALAKVHSPWCHLSQPSAVSASYGGRRVRI
jgi:hypothetical protein